MSSPAAAQRRAEMLDRARGWFARQAVLPVDTPAIGSAGTSDPNIDSLRLATGGFLQTSPEYDMKRLLAGGYPDIYSICRVFRGSESGRRHLQEFTMIEWYRLGFTLDDIVADACGLVHAMLGSEPLEATVDRLDYVDAFQRHAGIEPLSCPVETLAHKFGADAALLNSLNDDRDAWLDLLLADVVSPQFDARRLTVLQHYPASQAALARLCPGDPRLADRFEIFVGDLELANGYVELTDAAEQRQRMEEDRDKRQRQGKPDVAADERLLAAMNEGLPACAGVALGVERVHMLAEGVDDIDNVVTFR